MKITLDTARDQPRLIRTAIAMMLAALDDGSALPVTVPAGLVPTESELDPKAVFGGGAVAQPPLPPAPSTAGAPPPPPAPVAPPVTSIVPPAPPTNAVPPAPPVPAPSAPVPPSPPVPAGNTVALDKDNLPWDARIHAATKSKVANGTWKRKKGLPEETYNAVVAELRQTMAIPAPVGTVVAPPAAYVPAPPPVTPPPPAASATPPAPPAPPAVDAPITNFAEFMAWIAKLIAAGKWSHAQTSTALGSMGLPGAVALASRPDLIPTAVETIKAMIPA